jgi:mannose-6-phosphate isomerase-like protein (cupin superfamily)
MKTIHVNDVTATRAHGDLKRFRLISPGDLKSNIQTVNYVELLPGESFIAHDHPDCEECFFIIEGKVDALIDGKIVHLRAGNLLVVEQNELHQFTNTYQKMCRYVQWRVLV